MKTIHDIIATVPVQTVLGDSGMPVSGITSDSRQAGAGMLFVAVKGLQHDGHVYMDAVAELGVSCIVCNALPSVCKESVCYVVVHNTSAVIG